MKPAPNRIKTINMIVDQEVHWSYYETLPFSQESREN